MIFQENKDSLSLSVSDPFGSSMLSSSLPPSFFSPSFDTIEFRMSRIDRHRQRRFWKLQEREWDREYNRNLNKAIHESKIKKKRQVHHDILQELFSMEFQS
jgi:intergrase/recombinase